MTDKKISLPKEVLAHIFSFLDSRTRLNASSVCKRWMEVFNSFPDLLQNVCVCFIACSLRKLLNPFPAMTRSFFHFCFKFVEIDDYCFTFLERVSQEVRSLAFEFCEMSKQPNDRKLQNLNSLLELKMKGGKVLSVFPHLPALKILHFEINESFSKPDLEQLDRMTPHSLTELGLLNFVGMDSWEVFYHREIERFIQKRHTSLESLDLSGMHLPVYAIPSLLMMEDLKLKRLRLSSQFLSHHTVDTFCDHQRGIVTLELGDHTTPTDYRFPQRIYSFVDDAVMMAICTALPNLEELTLGCCLGFNGSVAMIFQLKRLRSLNLFGCNGINAKSFINAMMALDCKDLRILNLCDTHVSHSTLTQLLFYLPNLREITLSDNIFLDSKWVERLPRRRASGMTFVRRPNS